MNIIRNRAVTVAAGLGAVASSVGVSVIGLAGPASAAVAAPICNATQTDKAAVATVNAYNGAVLASYKKSPGFVKIHAKTTALYKAYAKAKGKAKIAAKKKYLAQVGVEGKAIAAFVRANYYQTYSGTKTPAAVTATDRVGLWHWGVYTTRIFTKGGAVVNTCTYVDETNAGNDQGTAATADDKATSADLYQGANKPMSLDIPGQLPVLWFATTVSPAKSAAAVNTRVATCATQHWDVITTACPKGGLSDPTSGLTGASYTVSGYEASLQAALAGAVKAKSVLA